MNTEIDNFNIIEPLLNFTDSGDFYMLYIFQRKKDQLNPKTHRSVRKIRSYCVENFNYLQERYAEIKNLCTFFNARAYIQINKHNHQDVSLNMMIAIAERLKHGHLCQKDLFDSVVDKCKYIDKRWIVDVDSKSESYLLEMIEKIKSIRPNPKIHATIPTKNGYHIITDGFDVSEFQKSYPLVDIQKKNPTLLYMPLQINQNGISQ
jgi:hypothetical protein